MIYPALVFAFTNNVADTSKRSLTKKSHLSITAHFREKIGAAKLPLSKIITKVNQFDSSLSCQEDVVAFDVTMDNPVVVQMLETLLN